MDFDMNQVRLRGFAKTLVHEEHQARGILLFAVANTRLNMVLADRWIHVDSHPVGWLGRS